MNFSDIKTDHQKCKFLVSKFVEKDNANWPREIKIAKKLIKIYPDIQLWFDLKLEFKLNSLAFFLTDDGKKEMTALRFNKAKENVLDFFPKGTTSFNEEKLGEDKKVELPKTNSLLDFLKKKV